MIITDAGLAQRAVAGSGPRAQMAGPRRYAHDCFEHIGNVRAGEPAIAMAALLDDRHKTARFEFRQMRAGGLQRHARFVGQLTCRQSFAV